MAHRPSHNYLRNLSYTKSSAEIVAKAKEKKDRVLAKIAEREGRIAKIRKEYDITDTVMIQLLAKYNSDMQSGNARMSASYNVNTPSAPNGVEITVGAGVIQNLMAETGLIEDEKASVEQLSMIIRNLRPTTCYANQTGQEYQDDSFSLTTDDLDFLGF